MNIGITGQMQNGKDTVANMIKEMVSDFEITHFADPLKEICINYLGLSYEDVYTSEGKAKYNDFWGMTNREILQKMGTEAFRKGFKSDVWVKLMELKLKNSNYIIPDVRFDDEAKVILDNDGIIINVIRPFVNNSLKDLSHESEKGVSKELITYTVINDSDLDSLKEKVKNILFDEKILN